MKIHPSTQNEDDDAALLIATMHGEFEMTRIIMKRLLMKHTGDINHQTKEGLTPLAVGVSCFWGGQRSIEVLRSLLDAGFDGNTQDHA